VHVLEAKPLETRRPQGDEVKECPQAQWEAKKEEKLTPFIIGI